MPAITTRLGRIPGAIATLFALLSAVMVCDLLRLGIFQKIPLLGRASLCLSVLASFYLAGRLLLWAHLRLSRDRIEWHDVRRWSLAIDEVAAVDWHRALFLDWVTLRGGLAPRDIFLFRVPRRARAGVVHGLHGLFADRQQRGWSQAWTKRYGACPLCASCGYPRIGLSGSRCPECGLDIGTA